MLGKMGKKFLKGAKNLSKGGAAAVIFIYGEDYLENSGTKIGHMGAEGIKIVDNATEAVFNTAWDFGNMIGALINRDTDQALEELIQIKDDIADGAVNIYGNISNIVKTASDLKLKDFGEYFKFQVESIKSGYEYITSNEFKKDLRNLENKVEDAWEYTKDSFEEAKEYYSTHSWSEVKRDIKSIWEMFQ